ncbi:NACHT domain-containing protein [Streptomyces sp. NPDC050658]|uniref:NACHT domain-containing protein n=1 Tax=unclassified Streptomyces TaxID=2593676 RepID=UPI003412F488
MPGRAPKSAAWREHARRFALPVLFALCVGTAVSFGAGLDVPEAGTLVLTLAAVVISLVALQAGHESGRRSGSLTAAAEYLRAEALERCRKQEREGLRQLGERRLRVSWTAPDPEDDRLRDDLFDEWSKLVARALSPDWRHADRTGSSEWASGPEQLAGSDDDPVGVLDRVPTRRLVFLGEAGAGKTTLMIRLVLALLERWEAGRPVPVLVPLASWDPTSTGGLKAWLEGFLTDTYKQLGEPAPHPHPARCSKAEALLREALVLPVLDGLDEIPEAVRGLAVSQINKILRPGMGLVLTSRIDPYVRMVRPGARRPVVKLSEAAGVVLRASEAADVERYLKEGAGARHAEPRWEPVASALRVGAPLSRALRNPLIANIADRVYNAPPGLDSWDQPLKDPAELTDTARFPTRAAIERYLLDAFVPAAYGTPAPDRRAWGERRRARRAERALRFLALHLERHLGDGRSIAWWELRAAVPMPLLAAAAGLVVAGAAAAAGALVAVLAYGVAPHGPGPGQSGLVGDSALGLRFFSTKRVWIIAGGAGLCAALMIWIYGRQNPVRGWRVWEYGYRGIVRLWVGVVFAGALSADAPFHRAVQAALYVALVCLFLVPAAPVAPAAGGDPRELLRRDRRTFSVTAVVVGMTAGAAAGMNAASQTEAQLGLAVGVFAGTGAGLVAGCGNSAWVPYTLAHCWLVLRRRLPWRLMALLEEAHKREVLRREGTVYQFRHLKLQHRLAEQQPGVRSSAPGRTGNRQLRRSPQRGSIPARAVSWYRLRSAIAGRRLAVVWWRACARIAPAACTFRLGYALQELGIRSGSANRESEALGVLSEALRVLRQGGYDDTAEVAGALVNIGDMLHRLGRVEEALPHTEKAIRMHRRWEARGTCSNGPSAVALAFVLAIFANQLAEAGRGEEALAAAGEAESRIKQLTPEQQRRHELYFARMLLDHSHHLWEAGDFEQARDKALEADGIYRRLAERNPRTYEPRRAESLTELSERLWSVASDEQAIDAMEQAEEIYRRLAGRDPLTYEPGHADCLTRLGHQLSQLDQRTAAFVVTGEAVEIYRRLSRSDPGHHEPDLARALTTYAAARLHARAELEEAAAGIADAIGILRRLDIETAGGYEEELADARETAARLSESLGH